MTLRYKTLLVIGLVLGALFVVLYLTVSSILVSGFNKVEDQAARQNVFRVVEAFQGEIAGLDRTLGDWAPWDATYTFVQDANQEYVENNLDDETVANLGLNIMLFYNTANQLVFGKGLDLVEKTGTPLPESVGNALATSNYSLLSHTSTDSTKSGVLLLEEAPLMIASRPILTSERQGPIEGSLVMGRFVDKREVKALEDKTRLKINVFRLDSKDQPADIDEALTALSGAQPEPGSANPPVFNKPLNQDRMAGYTVEKSVFGQPVLLFRVDMARDVHAQGQTSLQAFNCLPAGCGGGVRRSDASQPGAPGPGARGPAGRRCQRDRSERGHLEATDDARQGRAIRPCDRDKRHAEGHPRLAEPGGAAQARGGDAADRD